MGALKSGRVAETAVYVNQHKEVPTSRSPAVHTHTHVTGRLQNSTRAMAAAWSPERLVGRRNIKMVCVCVCVE